MNQTATSTTPPPSSSTTSTSPSAEAVAAANSKTTNTVATSAPAMARGGAVAAAAVAAANANANGNPTASSTTNGVKLIIKASNQQYEDQIIDCDLLWTVKRLKTQLALVYPSKPPVAEQKLIYSGQLLNDALQLKDVIRSYKDVYTHNHIFHLVYTPKNAPFLNTSQKSKASSKATVASSSSSSSSANMSTNGSAGDGLRQRHVSQQSLQQQQQQQPQQQQTTQQQQQSFSQYFSYAAPHNPLHAQIFAAAATTGASGCPQYDPNNAHNAMPFSFPGQFNVQAMATQQAAMYNWMQQVYSQYMEQCMRMSASAATAAGITNISSANAGTGSAPNVGALSSSSHPFLQQLPLNVVNAINPGNIAAAAGPASVNPVIPFPSATVTATATAAGSLVAPTPQMASASTAQAPQPSLNVATEAQAQAAPQESQPQPQQQQQQQQQPAQRHFPNIVQEEQEHRDWLESFFSITRLAVFLTILYFNASPLRCLVVVIIASGIYLYHIGVFRVRHERNNNNINRNNNAAVDADQIRQGVRQVQQAAQVEQQQQQQQQQPENPDNAPNPADEAQSTAQAADNNDDAAAPAVVAGAADTATTPLLPSPSSSQSTPNAETTAATAAAENNNSTSVISFIRTFVVTFFTSLLPETPTL